MDLEKYKSNHKTSYLAESFERLQKEEEEIQTMLKTDPSMVELAKKELAGIRRLVPISRLVFHLQ